MTARVSLIASTYRSERFLPAWLENIAAQTVWPEAELFVVANDPQPAEEELLTRFSEENPQVRLLTVPREPVYRSWNRAIAATSAPIVALANVDDLRSPGGLEAQVRALEEDDDALFTYGSFSISTAFPPTAEGSRPITAIPFEREEFTRSMRVGPFFVWRRTREPATQYFDEQLRVGGDMDLAVRLALRGYGVPVSEFLGFYFDGGTGLSTGGDRQQVEKAVLELRYGIYDKLDISYVPRATQYVIPNILLPDGAWLPLAEVVPGYAEFLDERRARWFRPPRVGWARRIRRRWSAG